MTTIEQQQRIPGAADLFKIPPRPTAYDEEIRRAAARLMAPRFAAWCCEADSSGDEFERLIEQLVDAASDSTDGFEIAYKLKADYSWDGDESLVELCSAFGSEINHQVDKAVELWITENHVAPLFAVGTRVLFDNTPPLPHYAPRGWLVGEIVDSYAKRGAYVVYVEALGHVREGIGSHGRILPWETDALRSAEGANE